MTFTVSPAVAMPFSPLAIRVNEPESHIRAECTVFQHLTSALCTLILTLPLQAYRYKTLLINDLRNLLSINNTLAYVVLVQYPQSHVGEALAMC